MSNPESELIRYNGISNKIVQANKCRIIDDFFPENTDINDKMNLVSKL